MRLTRTAIPAFVLVLAPLTLGENVSILDVAPKDAAFVVNIENFAATKASFDKTGMRKIWDNPKIKEWVLKHSKEMVSEMSHSLEDAGIKLDELNPPSGHVGMAGWVGWSKEKAPEFRIISIADFGDKADGTAKMIEDAIDKASAKKTITVKEDEYAGHKVYTLDEVPQPKPEKKAAKKKDGDEPDDADAADGDEGNDEHPAAMPELTHFVYSRAGTYLVVASEMDTMERALDRFGGKSSPSVSDNPDLAGVTKNLNGAKDYAVLLTGPLVALLDKVIDEAKAGNPHISGGFGEEPRVTSILQLAGLTGIRGAGVGVRFDTDAGLMEQTYSVLATEKKGIVGLFDAPAAKFAAPAFASADAAGVTMVQFKFADLISTLLDISKGFPPDMSQMMEQQIQQAQIVLGPILAQLGPQVYFVQSYAKPYGIKSSQTIGAIAVKDPAALNQSLSGFAQMVGLTSRDFQGNQVWSMPEGGGAIPGMSGTSLAVGFGYLFIGASAQVENALRQAGAQGAGGEAAGLAKEARFTNAVRAIKNEGYAFGYSDFRQMLEYTQWTLKNPDQVVLSHLEGMFGNDPEAEKYKAEAAKRAKESMPEWVKDMPELDPVFAELGDTVFEVQNTPDGMQGRSIWLRPGAKK